jgi:hypothetical protein
MAILEASRIILNTQCVKISTLEKVNIMTLPVTTASGSCQARYVVVMNSIPHVMDIKHHIVIHEHLVASLSLQNDTSFCKCKQ